MVSPAISGTGQLRERLDKVYDKTLERSIPYYIQPELYHYTNVEGLRGIIESNRLRVTSAYYLNDSSEVEYGCQLVTDVCEEWLKANSADDKKLSLIVIRFLKSMFVHPLSRISRYVGIYVSCFCENGNLLSQWRAYGQAGGYSIGMLSSELDLGLRSPGIFSTRLLKVTYDQGVQRSGIHSVLKDFIDAVEGAESEIPTEPEPQKVFLSQLVGFLEELLLDKIVAYKHPAFEEEREWRVVARPRILDFHRESEQKRQAGEAQDQGQPKEHDVKYRASKGVLVPFLELEPEDELLPIHSVRFGPSLDKFTTEYSLRGFLAQHGYNQVKVVGCDTPVLL